MDECEELQSVITAQKQQLYDVMEELEECRDKEAQLTVSDAWQKHEFCAVMHEHQSHMAPCEECPDFHVTRAAYRVSLNASTQSVHLWVVCIRHLSSTSGLFASAASVAPLGCLHPPPQ